MIDTLSTTCMRPTSAVSNESKVLMPNRTISDILSQFNPCRRVDRAIGCILTDWDTFPLGNLLIHWRPLGGGTGVVEGRFRLHYNNYSHTHTRQCHAHTLPLLYVLQVWSFSCLPPDLSYKKVRVSLGMKLAHTHRKREG